ncbi:MAG: flippase-like domain-containing protein [Phycisphaerae bacterium]|nr:flippase-like domain-containing protein [Phycisphaerae bacterium]
MPNATPATTPTVTAPAAAPAGDRSGGRALARTLIQLLGFGVGVLLLVWAARTALKPEYREQLTRLASAPWEGLGLLALLCVATVVLNGLVFRATLAPVRLLPAGDMIAVNALSTTLSYLPFKLSLIVRVLIHMRRHGLPLLVIGSWFAAVIAGFGASYLPALGASLWLRRVDALWFAVLLAGCAGAVAAIVLGARFMGRGRVWERLTALAPARVLPPAAAEKLRSALVMLADARAVTLTVGLRLTDLFVQSARFYVAGRLVGQPVPAGDAVLAAATFFVIQSLSPAGILGAREAGTIGLFNLLHSPTMAVVTLAVSAVEALVNLVFATGAAAYLRLDRVLRAPVARAGAGS